MVPSVLVSDIEEFLNANGLSFRVGIEDVQELLDSQVQKRELAISSTADFNYDIFHSYQEVSFILKLYWLN